MQFATLVASLTIPRLPCVFYVLSCVIVPALYSLYSETDEFFILFALQHTSVRYDLVSIVYTI